MSNSNFVTLKDASKILNVSSETLRNWDKQGKLKATRHPVNKYRLYNLNEINNLNQVSTVAERQATYHTPSLFEDEVSFKSAIKSMSKAFRDSQGGGLLERFEEISKLLFCKIFDERHLGGLTFGGFSRVYPDEKIYGSLCDLFEKAKKEYPNVFVNGRAEISPDQKAIVQVAFTLQRFRLAQIGSDVKGKVYEELIKNNFDKNENQQFFTPRHIVDFMIQILNPQASEKICDPACGSGGFLIAALEYVSKKNEDTDIEQWCREKVVGAEIDSRMVWTAQMNLILHGGHHDSVKYLKEGGSLSHTPQTLAALPDGSMDIIVTNPPFGSDFDQKSELEQFVLGRGKKSRRRGILFVEKCLRLLRPGGRMAIVLEESILNNNSSEDVRLFMEQNAIIESVFSLPDTAFMPYATVKTSIVVLHRKQNTMEKQGQILMCNLEETGFAPNGDPCYSDERDHDGRLKLRSDLPEALEKWSEFLEKGKVTRPNERHFSIMPSREEMIQRLDTLYFHPARQNAQTLLQKSKYPLHRLGEVVTSVNQMIVPQYECPDESIRYIGLANIQPHEGSYFVSDVLGEKIKSAVKVFHPETVVFAKLRPDLRKVIFIPKEEESGFVSSECYVFRASPRVLPQYLELMLRSDLVYGQIIFQVTGLGRPRIGKAELLNVKIPIPPLDKQREIVRAMYACQSNRQILLDKSQLLRQEADDLVRKGFHEIERDLC